MAACEWRPIHVVKEWCQVAEQLQHPIQGLHCCHWTCALVCTTNKNVGTSAHLISFWLLYKIMQALSGPANVLHGRMEPGIETPVFGSKFANPQETEEAKG